jgi:hypothetical protein
VVGLLTRLFVGLSNLINHSLLHVVVWMAETAL